MPTIRALVVTAIDTISCTTIEMPEPGPGEVAVDMVFTAVSPGTEARTMRGLQVEDCFPYVPGYSGAGTISAVGPGVDMALGTPVFCAGTKYVPSGIQRVWGGHVERAVLGATQVLPLPAGCDLKAASATHLAAIAYHGVRMARPVPGEQVVVLGLGPIGLLSALIHRTAGVRVLACDRSAARVKRAQGFGLEAVVVESSVAAAIFPIMPKGADIVVDATGHPKALAEAAAVARDLAWGDDNAPGARLVVQGSYPVDVALPYRDVFSKELAVIVPRDCTPGDLQRSLDLVARGLLPLADLISETAQPSSAESVYAELRKPDTNWVTAAFQWR
jgi:2-desacetyl-2-hydroxyethyl bacteriochlorophyllide A dehydrogenase